MSEQIQIGDYVLATKWSDGDVGDQWAVGFLESLTSHNPPRYMVADNAGKQFRGNGFRRITKISQHTGSRILESGPYDENSGFSIYSILAECLADELDQLRTALAAMTAEKEAAEARVGELKWWIDRYCGTADQTGIYDQFKAMEARVEKVKGLPGKVMSALEREITPTDRPFTISELEALEIIQKICELFRIKLEAALK